MEIIEKGGIQSQTSSSSSSSSSPYSCRSLSSRGLSHLLYIVIMVWFRTFARNVVVWHVEAFIHCPSPRIPAALQKRFRLSHPSPLGVHNHNQRGVLSRCMSVPRGGDDDRQRDTPLRDDGDLEGRSRSLLKNWKLKQKEDSVNKAVENGNLASSSPTSGHSNSITTTTTIPDDIDDDDDDDDKQSNVTSSSSSSLFRSSAWQKLGNRLLPWTRSLRRRAGEVVTLGGFLSSATTSLYTHRHSQWQRLQPTVDALKTFLKDSRLDTQLSQSVLNIRLLDNLVLLGRLQKQLHQDTVSLAKSAALTTTSVQSTRKQQGQEDAWVPTAPQALRWMKFATAAYGNAMIRAAQLDVEGKYNTSSSLFSSETTMATRVSEHCNVPMEDLVLLDIEYHGNDEHLRHFVAVDHAHQEILLSLRGTFSVAEIVVDAAAFATTFGGGQAHAEMAKQALLIWQRTGPKIMEICQANPEYTVVITGHSLGAGTACLLHLLLHEEKGQDTPRNQIRCVAFAAPPVYTNPHPTQAIQQAMRRCVNFVHDHDMVPFLSVDSVRHLMSSLEFVQDKTREIRYRDRLRLFWGYAPMDPEWIQEFQNRPRLDPLPGAPVLTVPAAVNVWLTPCPISQERNEDDDSSEDDCYDPNGYYQAYRCNSYEMATRIGLQVDLNMLQDHFPPRYEHALHHFHPDESI